MSFAPICLFVYNRLDHTQKTVEFLKKNSESTQTDLFIFSDYAKKPEGSSQVQEVRDYIKTIDGFKSVNITERETNFGLANSIIDGVSKVVDQYGKVIVLEDDMITSPYFLKYLNDALDFYENSEKVASIHAYTYPIKEKLQDTFFLKGADCWGWATWKNKWAYFNPNGKELLQNLKENNLISEFNFNDTYPYSDMLKNQIAGKNDSWAIRWYASAFINNLYTLYPKQSLVQNIGNDDSGTHCASTDEFEVQLYKEPLEINNQNISRDDQAYEAFATYFRSLRGNRYKRALSKIRQMIGF